MTFQMENATTGQVSRTPKLPIMLYLEKEVPSSTEEYSATFYGT